MKKVTSTSSYKSSRKLNHFDLDYHVRKSFSL